MSLLIDSDSEMRPAIPYSYHTYVPTVPPHPYPQLLAPHGMRARIQRAEDERRKKPQPDPLDYQAKETHPTTRCFFWGFRGPMRPFFGFFWTRGACASPARVSCLFRFLSFFVVLSSCQTFTPAATSPTPAAPGDRAAGPRSRGPRRASRSPRAAASSPSRRASPRRGRVSAAARP